MPTPAEITAAAMGQVKPPATIDTSAQQASTTSAMSQAAAQAAATASYNAAQLAAQQAARVGIDATTTQSAMAKTATPAPVVPKTSTGLTQISQAQFNALDPNAQASLKSNLAAMGYSLSDAIGIGGPVITSTKPSAPPVSPITPTTSLDKTAQDVLNKIDTTLSGSRSEVQSKIAQNVETFVKSPITQASLPSDASALAKGVASLGDAYKARDAQQAATGQQFSQDWWLSTYAFAQSKGIPIETAYYMRSGEKPSFNMPAAPAATPEKLSGPSLSDTQIAKASGLSLGLGLSAPKPVPTAVAAPVASVNIGMGYTMVKSDWDSLTKNQQEFITQASNKQQAIDTLNQQSQQKNAQARADYISQVQAMQKVTNPLYDAGLLKYNPDGSFTITDVAKATSLVGTDALLSIGVQKSDILAGERQIAGGPQKQQFYEAPTAVPTSSLTQGAGFLRYMGGKYPELAAQAANVPLNVLPPGYKGKVGPTDVRFESLTPAQVKQIPSDQLFTLLQSSREKSPALDPANYSSNMSNQQFVATYAALSGYKPDTRTKVESFIPFLGAPLAASTGSYVNSKGERMSAQQMQASASAVRQVIQGKGAGGFELSALKDVPASVGLPSFTSLLSGRSPSTIQNVMTVGSIGLVGSPFVKAATEPVSLSGNKPMFLTGKSPSETPIGKLVTVPDNIYGLSATKAYTYGAEPVTTIMQKPGLGGNLPTPGYLTRVDLSTQVGQVYKEGVVVPQGLVRFGSAASILPQVTAPVAVIREAPIVSYELGGVGLRTMSPLEQAALSSKMPTLGPTSMGPVTGKLGTSAFSVNPLTGLVGVIAAPRETVSTINRTPTTQIASVVTRPTSINDMVTRTQSIQQTPQVSSVRTAVTSQSDLSRGVITPKQVSIQDMTPQQLVSTPISRLVQSSIQQTQPVSRDITQMTRETISPTVTQRTITTPTTVSQIVQNELQQMQQLQNIQQTPAIKEITTPVVTQQEIQVVTQPATVKTTSTTGTTKAFSLPGMLSGLSMGGGGGGGGAPWMSRGGVGSWNVRGMGVYAPSPVTGKIVGGQVGKKSIKYGIVESKSAGGTSRVPKTLKRFGV